MWTTVWIALVILIVGILVCIPIAISVRAERKEKEEWGREGAEWVKECRRRDREMEEIAKYGMTDAERRYKWEALPESCGVCKFWLEWDENEYSGTSACIRYPTPVQTSRRYLCGEFKRRLMPESFCKKDEECT